MVDDPISQLREGAVFLLSVDLCVWGLFREGGGLGWLAG